MGNRCRASRRNAEVFIEINDGHRFVMTKRDSFGYVKRRGDSRLKAKGFGWSEVPSLKKRYFPSGVTVAPFSEKPVFISSPILIASP